MAYTMDTAFRNGRLDLSTSLVLPPMASEKSDDGRPSRSLIDYYLDFAANPHIGLIVTEHAFVDPQGKASPRQVSLASDDVVDAHRALTDAVHEARPGLPIIAQINHAGMSTSSATTGQETVSASENETKRGVSRALTVDEIHAIVQRFAKAATRAIEAGYDGVEIHASHTYLLNQFYSPITNRRDDEYGCASVEDRIRMTLEVVRAVRKAMGPDGIISVRLGGCDYREGGSTIDDAVEAAKLLEAEGIDLLSITGGMCSYVNPFDSEPGWFQDMSRAIKAQVSTPILLTGGITTPEQADALLADGAADLIGVARALLKNPRWACED